jgi:hypothetical protein
MVRCTILPLSLELPTNLMNYTFTRKLIYQFSWVFFTELSGKNILYQGTSNLLEVLKTGGVWCTSP